MGAPPGRTGRRNDPLSPEEALGETLRSPAPTDERAEVMPLAEDNGEGPSKVLDAFLLAQSADVADEERTIGKWGSNGEGLEVEKVPMGDEDFVAVGFEVPIRNKAWRI